MDSDLLKSCIMEGASDARHSFRITVGIPLGLTTLFGSRSFNTFETVSSITRRSDKFGLTWIYLKGRFRFAKGRVNTELKKALNISAFSSGVVAFALSKFISAGYDLLCVYLLGSQSSS